MRVRQASMEPSVSTGNGKGALVGVRAPNYLAILVLLTTDVILSINQTTVASVYNMIEVDFGAGVYGLGILTAAFFLAYGVSEVPGGILAARIGLVRIMVAGALANAVGVVGSALTHQFVLLVVFRFAAGIGFALAFPSILVLTVRLFRAGSEGVAGSLVFVAGSVGMIIGLTPWVVLSQAIGWRASFLIGGVMDVAAAAAVLLLVPRDRVERRVSIRLKDIKALMFSKHLVVLSSALLGFGTFVSLTSNFTTFYLEESLGASPTFASTVTELSIILPMITAPISGKLFDRLRRPREFVLTAAIGSAAGLGIIALGTASMAVAGIAVAGLATGVFSMGLVIAREIAAPNPEFESLTVAWVDSFSLYGNFVSPLYFSILSSEIGYSYAWGVSGVIGLLLSLPILTMKRLPMASRASTLERPPDADGNR